jgi:hypothetical protein
MSFHERKCSKILPRNIRWIAVLQETAQHFELELCVGSGRFLRLNILWGPWRGALDLLLSFSYLKHLIGYALVGQVSTKQGRLDSLIFQVERSQVQFLEQPIDNLVRISMIQKKCPTCLIEGSAIRSLDGLVRNGMLVYWP